MRNILLPVFLLFPICVYSMTMCVHTDSYIATLVKTQNGTSISTDGAGGWTTVFNYATSNRNTNSVTGFASCNEVVGTANTADDAVSAAITDTGINCWCSMGAPLVSDWVYLSAYSTDSDCATGCATACANAVKTSTTFRTAMFESVW